MGSNDFSLRRVFPRCPLPKSRASSAKSTKLQAFEGNVCIDNWVNYLPIISLLQRTRQKSLVPTIFFGLKPDWFKNAMMDVNVIRTLPSPALYCITYQFVHDNLQKIRAHLRHIVLTQPETEVKKPQQSVTATTGNSNKHWATVNCSSSSFQIDCGKGKGKKKGNGIATILPFKFCSNCFHQLSLVFSPY